MIGVHTVTIYPDPALPASVDISCLVEQVQIQHGRDDTTQQPVASTVSVDLDLFDEVLPVEVEIGAGVKVTTRLAGLDSVRFVGTVTDVETTWDDAGEQTPNAGAARILAASALADLGRRVVGDAPWPAELDGARVSRVLALVGVVTDPITSDPGIVQIMARDVDATDALSVVAGVAGSASGVVWQTRAGQIRYADANHRQGIPAEISLDACVIEVAPVWSRTLQGLINDASVGYGPPAAGGDQPRVVDSSVASIDRYGRYAYSVATELAAAADAAALAGILVARNATPVWVMPTLPVAVDVLDEATTLDLLGLEMHSLVTLSGLPIVAPGAPSTASVWVEGWSETLAWGSHEIELAVSGYCRTVPAPTWDAMPPETTWDSVGTLTWDNAVCIGPPLQLGRWADVPASARWNTTPPAVTWDTWDAYVSGGSN